MNQYVYVRPRDDGQGWAVDVYDGRRAWAKTHLGERPLNKAEAHRVAHKLRDPKFYSVRTKRAVNSGAQEGMVEARVGTMPGSGIPLPRPLPGRCSTRCDHDSRCTLPDGHTPADRHETEHGCICYDQRPGDTREGWRNRALVADTELRNALSGESDAVRRAESAELGCEIAYRRDPTQAEGDAHELTRGEGAIRECHVPMGDHHGHRCPCGQWVWGGPTVCQRCVDADAVKIALEWKAEADRLRLRADTDAKAIAAWNRLYDERYRLWREEADRVGAVKLLLEANGCDCDCGHDAESHDSDCDRCLACRISWAIET